jgi:hypothetical protein
MRTPSICGIGSRCSSLRVMGPLAPLMALLLIGAAGCAPPTSTPDGSGGTSGGTGGSGTGGSASTGGTSGTGGVVGTGGRVIVGTGGAGTGGSATGGSGSGGSGSGGSGSGGTAGGRSGSGGSQLGGAGGGVVGAGGAAAPGCAGKTYKVCEDFETGTTGGIPTGWTAFKGYGAGAPTDVGLATDQFHSGSRALKSSSMATGQGRVQKSLTAIGATASKHWGRIFYKVQSPSARNAAGVLHVTFVGLFGTGENRVVDIVEAANGTHQWLYNNPNDAGSLGSPYSWTFDTVWHCAEWYVDVSTHSFRFFTDSKEVPQIGFTGKADSQMSNYNSIIVGATFYQTPSTPFVMWFDDLAIDDNQIFCQ